MNERAGQAAGNLPLSDNSQERCLNHRMTKDTVEVCGVDVLVC